MHKIKKEYSGMEKCMKQYPAEKKLLLAKMLRAENQNNRMAMRKCEQILYGGRASYEPYMREEYPETEGRGAYGSGEMKGSPGSGLPGSLKLRFTLAVLLFVGFIAWDNGYYPALGENTAQVYEWIGEDDVLSELSAFLNIQP